MKKNILFIIMVLLAGRVCAEPAVASVPENKEKTKMSAPVEVPKPIVVPETPKSAPVLVKAPDFSWAEKMIDVRGLVGADGKLKESIGIETLSNVITPILKQGMHTPLSLPLKLGAAEGCDGCAKVKLFRMGKDDSVKPTEIGFFAINGFTNLQKKQPVVIVDLQIANNSKITLKALPFQHADQLTFVDVIDVPKLIKLVEPAKIIKEEKPVVLVKAVQTELKPPVSLSKIEVKSGSTIKIVEDAKKVSDGAQADQKKLSEKPVVEDKPTAVVVAKEIVSVKQN